MPSISRSRTIAASAQELWRVIGDPHHLPRWWPRVTRVENVEGEAFTEVLSTASGKIVRADFRLIQSEEPTRVCFSQQLDGTPFARLLKSAETEMRLEPATGERAGEPPSGGGRADEERVEATRVTIELRQSLSGFFPRFGSYMVRRAGASTLEEALDGLERISV